MTAPENSLANIYNPLSHWQLSESSGTVAADSEGLSNGQYRNGVGLGQSGRFTGNGEAAAAFDGRNDYVEIGHNEAFELANGTLQLWFNPASVDGIQNLFSKDVKGKADHFGMWLSGGEISIRSQSNSRTRSLGSGPGLVKAGEWNHVAVSWGNSGFRLYLNGQKVDEDTSWKAGWVDNQESILIGADNQFSDSQRTDKPEFFFNGKLDDVALYNRALSGADIARLFDGNGGWQWWRPCTPNPSNLAPLAQDNNYQVEQGKPLSVNATQGVLLNDSDPVWGTYCRR